MGDRQSFKDAFQKKFKKEDVQVVTANSVRDINTYPSGILSFDVASGCGGFPQGRIVEVFGPESGGKSLLTLVSVAYDQKSSKSPSLYFDLEGGTPREWLETLGLNIELFDIVPAGLNAGQVLDAICLAIEEGNYRYIIIDSVAAMIPRAELEGQIDKSYMAELARTLSLGIKKVSEKLSTTPNSPCVIMINQIREKPGIMFGNPESTPGGRALKFYSAQRYRVTKKAQSEKTAAGDVVGHIVKVVNKKNKLGPPGRESEFFINYTEGVDTVGTIFAMMKDQNLYEKKGQKYILTVVNSAGETSTIEFDKVGDIKDKLATDLIFQEQMYKQCIDKHIGTYKVAAADLTSNEIGEFDDEFQKDFIDGDEKNP
jgi:recombination protein RecA